MIIPAESKQIAGSARSPVRSDASYLTRRQFICAATGLSVAASAGPTSGGVTATREGPRVHQSTSELVMLDALDLSRSIKAKRVSCVEVMAAFLDHLERMNPKVNPIVSLQPRG